MSEIVSIMAYTTCSAVIILLLLAFTYVIRQDNKRLMKKVDILVEKVISLKYR